MNSSMVELSPALQSLVDERLDSIERILLVAGVSRGERRGILSEVEAHVFELLARRTTVEPTREDVLAVLAQLDPPESYAPEGFDRRKVNEAFAKPKPREPELSLLAAGSAVSGAFLLLGLIMTVMAGGDGPLVAFEAMAMLAVSTIGAICLFRIRRSNGWLYGVRPALVATLLFPMVAVNVLVVLFLSAVWDVAAFLGVSIVFLAFNGAVIYCAWRMCEKLVKLRIKGAVRAPHAD